MNPSEQRAVPDQDATPYTDALRAKASRDVLDLMVPGHGQTADGLSRDLADVLGERALRLDIPQLVDGIDVGPDSPLVESLNLAADAWSARRTWFLTGGASQANRMALIALAAAGSGAGSSIVAQRSAHSSFIDGVIVGGLHPRFVVPSIDEARGINHGLTPESVDAELAHARDRGDTVAGVYVISPSYFGAVSDVAGIADVAHRHRVPLIVDGAWGAHFGFHPEFPESPTRLGADIVVSSTHKLGGSLSQSAMLHLSEGPFADQLAAPLERAFLLTQSTSASALLMASLDIARRSLVQHTDLIGQGIAHVDAARERLRSDGRFEIISDRFTDFPDIVAHDPQRLSVDISSTGLTGHEVKDALYSEFGIIVELATVRAIVAFIGPGKFPDLDRLVRALCTLAERAEHGEPSQVTHAADAEAVSIPPLPSPGPVAIDPRTAYFGTHEVVSADRAVGRVSADALAAYPPGIPNLLPGEVITGETVHFLQAVAASPVGYVRGAQDGKVSRFRVLAEEFGP